MVKVYSLDQLNQVMLFFCHASFSLSTRFKLYVICNHQTSLCFSPQGEL